MTESQGAMLDERRKKIIDSIQRIERQLVISLSSKSRDDLDLEKVSELTDKFELGLLAVLIKPAVAILEDKYYFPKITQILDYIKERYGIDLPYSKSKKTVAKNAAQVVLRNNGLETLQGDVRRIREQLSQKPQIPRVNVHEMEIDEIRREFSDTSKYPTIKDIKAAVKGIGLSEQIRGKKTRESVIEAILGAVRRSRSIRVFSKTRD